MEKLKKRVDNDMEEDMLTLDDGSEFESDIKSDEFLDVGSSDYDQLDHHNGVEYDDKH